VELASAANVISRIEQAMGGAPGPAGAIAFDGDGTLWSGDVGDDLWDAARAKSVFRPPAVQPLYAEARAHGLPEQPSVDGMAAAINDAYVTHAFPEERMYELIAWCFAGWERGPVREFCREVLDRRRHVAQLHAEALAVLEWAMARGIRVLVVSASPRDIVEEASVPARVKPTNVLASTPRYDASGVMQAEVFRPIPYGPGKVRAIREAIGTTPLWAAFGDNAFDVAMLSEARVAVAVRPKDRLRAREADVPGIIEIRREES
jgi:phosphoserine phosphatase